VVIVLFFGPWCGFRPCDSSAGVPGVESWPGKDSKIIYRHYATLFFMFVVDSSESELGILDLIQVPGPAAGRLKSHFVKPNEPMRQLLQLWLFFRNHLYGL